mmetsp:Transcript_161067/g.283837  ORF Transcript_161067/g.283837 Transcript_161067/m.283837 type:complete len:285 (+) Transcript_161067:2-856(+)
MLLLPQPWHSSLGRLLADADERPRSCKGVREFIAKMPRNCATKDLIRMTSIRDVLFKDLTVQRTYSNVFRGLARWELIAEHLVEQVVDVELVKDLILTEPDAKSEAAVEIISTAVSEALATEFNGSAKDLSKTMSMNLAEHLCEKIKIGTSTAELSNEVEIEMQTPMTASDALIIIKTRGDVNIVRRERLGNVKVTFDVAMKLIILDHAKLQSMNEDPKLNKSISKEPDNYVVNQVFSTNALVTGYRTHWHKPEPWSAMQSIIEGPPAEQFKAQVEAKRAEGGA